MLLKVGDLARRAGLTVRTLHHYDEIGLLKPSGRSDAGYRLYSQADVQRLHSIQTMRQMGLALGDIGELLAGEGVAPQRIISQQIRALDDQIARATDLRSRLAMLRDGLVAGAEPDMGNWLETLALMTTYRKHFSTAELKRIFESWKTIEADWLAVKDGVRRAMDQQLPRDAPEVQALAYRWMALMLQWMHGDMDLLERWGHMFRTEPTAQGRNHAPPGDMIDYIEGAIKLRMALLEKYLQPEDFSALGHVPHHAWADLQRDVQALMARALPCHHPDALACARRWSALLDTLASHDSGLRARLMQATASEPLLQAGSPLSSDVRAYLQAAAACAQPGKPGSASSAIPMNSTAPPDPSV